MRIRTKPITDIVLSVKEEKRLHKGYAVYRNANGHKHCIRVSKDRKAMRAILKLKAKIKILELGIRAMKGESNGIPS